MKDGRILTEEDYAKDYSVPVPDELLHTVHVGESPKRKSGFPVMEKRM